LKQFLQKIVIVTIVGIEVLSADYFEDTAKAFLRRSLADRKDGIIEAQVAETFVKG
jgi:hypothetical protein